MSFEELERLVRLFVSLGVERVRLTGGEPLVRRELPLFISRLAMIPGLGRIAMTSNGELLRRFAEPLYQAGLRELNVSIDSLEENRFRSLTGGGSLAAVLDGIAAAQEAGFRKIKLNAVTLGPESIEEAMSLCEWAWLQRCLPRFIEEMPLGALERASAGARSNQELRQTLGARHPLRPAPTLGESGLGPARYWEVQRGPFTGHRVGFIDPMSDSHFCAHCNRIRLTATGGLRACLADDREVELGAALRAGATDHDLIGLIKTAIYGKRERHRLHEAPESPRKAMIAIGG